MPILLWVRTHLMFELDGLNDRAASERRPQARLSLGFKGPATPLLSAVREEMGTLSDKPTRAEVLDNRCTMRQSRMMLYVQTAFSLDDLLSSPLAENKENRIDRRLADINPTSSQSVSEEEEWTGEERHTGLEGKESKIMYCQGGGESKQKISYISEELSGQEKAHYRDSHMQKKEHEEIPLNGSGGSLMDVPSQGVIHRACHLMGQYAHQLQHYDKHLIALPRHGELV
ncbi:hypothetical protein EYF80_041266 [Liparis tanakae]|uniref:Uncharacterized protein n=1 Tax=Liparis tanakae TaxID=230148 RepID=A0A4Z2G7H8_9TELE|nr:hypothetical protein EYF80_041266 [Liparis tanakae]